MIDATDTDSDRRSRKVRAEAVAWLARLQTSERDHTLENGLRRWLSASPEHSAAFEMATDVWEALGGVPTAVMLRNHVPDRQRFGRPRWTWLTAGATACVAVLVAVIWYGIWPNNSDLSTRVGEQRTFTLADGSRVALNTDTRLVLGQWNDTREVRLKRGEAYFEVAKNPDRPFVVLAGDKKVVAIGTTFDVRIQPNSDGDNIAVTLIEGKVAVTDLAVPPKAVLSATVRAPILKTGQRMMVANSEAGPGRIDLPKLDALTAWRRGEVVLDNARLGDAVAEMNRYNSIVLTIEDAATANLPISGIFRTGDSDAFAGAVATLYGLTVVKESQKLVLSGKPIPH